MGGGLFSWKNPVNCVWELVGNGRRKMERWLTDVYVGPWLKIYFSWGFWLSWMLRWILGSLFVYWFWKPLAHSCVFMWFSVPVRHREMDDKFWRKNYFNNPTHLISKLRLLGTFSQKKLEKKISKKNMKTCSYSFSSKKKKPLKIKGYPLKIKDCWQGYSRNK